MSAQVSSIVRRSRRATAVLAAVVVLVPLGAVSAPALAAPEAAYDVVRPQLACAELIGRDYDAGTGDRARISAAVVVPASAEVTAPYCLASGVVAPAHAFEVRLPTTTWTQRYLQTGCGGFCGEPPAPQLTAQQGCELYDTGEFAVAYGNGGHSGTSALDGSFGADKRLVPDFAYESEHQLSVVAKSVIREFYGQPARQSYFNGCSNGGRQAMVLTQRYPTDFDGVIAGAPAYNWASLLVFSLGWNIRANTAADGSEILTVDDLPVLHAAALAACDDVDGLTDGLITDPRRCSFDPGVLLCPTAGAAGCLTAAEVESARKIYAGARDPAGRAFYPGGMPVGSELAWNPWIVRAAPGAVRISEGFARDYLRYLSTLDPATSYDLDTIAFDWPTYRRLTELNRVFGAADPDLSAFRAAGGKLILWHGWNDPAIPAEGIIAYHDAIRRFTPGVRDRGTVNRFARLYLVPGMYHCADGDGPWAMDLLTPLTRWVEDGIAPTRIVTRSPETGAARPIYPYPRVAVHTGGDPDKAGSFVGRVPADNPQTDWAGGFTTGDQQKCRVVDGRLVCAPVGEG